MFISTRKTVTYPQDSHSITHLSVVTSAVMYSPEIKKNESVQNVTR